MLEEALGLEVGLSGFKLNGHSFLPIIAPNKQVFISGYHNTVMIPVDLTLSSPLQFDKVVEEAFFFKNEKIKIVWDLKFGFFQERVQLHVENFQNAFLRGLECFLEEVYPKFKEETIGALLFKGDADLLSIFPFNDYHKIHFQEFLQDTYASPSYLLETPAELHFDHLNYDLFETSIFTKHLKNLYCHHFFSKELHKIAALLPEGVLPFVQYDAKRIEHKSFLAQIFSKKRYTHLSLIIENQRASFGDISSNPIIKANGYLFSKEEEIQTRDQTIGLILPNDKELLYSVHLELEKALEKMPDVRIVPEFLVTESWEGLDSFIFLKRALSSNGKRILQGFCITGGSLFYLDEPLGFENETRFK